MRKNRPGMKTFFTFIEVLVTMLIMTIIAALVIGAFHTGLMSYKKANAFDTPPRHVSSAIAVIKEDLRHFVPVDLPRISFEKNKMAFPIVNDKPESHLELITYSIENSNLRRRAEKYSDTDDGMGNTDSSVLLYDVNTLAFSYENGSLPIKQEKEKKEKKKDDKDKKDKECWPALVALQGEIKGGYKLDASILFPLFNPQEKGKQ